MNDLLATSPQDGQSILKRVLIVFAISAAGTVIATQLAKIPALSDYAHLAVGALFLGLALREARALPNGLAHFGIELGGVLDADQSDGLPPGPFGLFELARTMRSALPAFFRELFVALGVATIVFVPFAAGFYFWHQPTRPFELTFPDEFLSLAGAHLIVVAIPEEAFFRGFVQTRLLDHFDPQRKSRFLGAPMALNVLLLQALLFALVHFVVDLNPAKLAVFFPALWFGMMRAWRGGIGAGVLVHAMSNIYSSILFESWLRP